MPPFRWYTSSKPRLFTKAVDFSQRMPPVQNIATFGRFPSFPRFCAKLSNQAGNSPKLPVSGSMAPWHVPIRSEEHTSELQSLMRISYAVFCLKKTTYLIQLHVYNTM